MAKASYRKSFSPSYYNIQVSLNAHVLFIFYKENFAVVEEFCGCWKCKYVADAQIIANKEEN